MPLLFNVETERVPLSTPGEWVDVKTKLSKAERNRIQAAAMKMQVQVKNGAAEIGNVDLGEVLDGVTFTGIEVGVVAWSFSEELTPTNIRLLSEDDYEIIAKRVNQLWEARSADDAANLSESSPMPLTAKANGRRT